MAKYETVSVKIPTELKRKMKEHGIKPAEIVRKAIQEEVRRREAEEIDLRLRKLKPILDKISVEEIVAMIREDRESR